VKVVATTLVLLMVSVEIVKSGTLLEVTSKLVRESNSKSEVLRDLASERFSADSAAGVLRVLTTHPQLQDSRVQDYTDGEWIISSIPVTKESCEGYENYATLYNGWHIQDVDDLVGRGRFKDAEIRLVILQKYSVDRLGELGIGPRLLMLKKVIAKQVHINDYTSRYHDKLSVGVKWQGRDGGRQHDRPAGESPVGVRL